MVEAHTRIQALDGLRAVSILLVVTSHAWLGHVIPGGLGVTVFFFISGFIITKVLLAEYVKSSTISIVNFYARRCFRLMPALMVYLLVALLVMIATEQPVKAIDFAAVLFYLSNYYQIYIGFSHDLMNSPLRITWSLAIEEHFYFIYPALLLALIGRWRTLLAIIGISVIAILCWRVYLVSDLGINDFSLSRIYMGTDTRVDTIFYGAALALLCEKSKRTRDFLKGAVPFWLGVLILASTLIVRNDIFRETIRYSLQGISLMLLFKYPLSSGNVFSRFLELPVMTYVGRISYSLYLYHWLILGLVALWMPQAGYFAKLAVLFFFSFLCAHLSYYYVERPFLEIGRQFLARRQRLELVS